MKIISEFIDIIDKQKVPQHIRDSVPVIEGVYGRFLEYQSQFDGLIYGTNTLPGHRDGDIFKGGSMEQYQAEFICKHRIGGAPFFEKDIAQCITLAKAYSIMQGGVPISGTLLSMILDCVESESFHPQIPNNSSYSSGDVIPAAHWAFDLLQWHKDKSFFQFRAGEGMALVNGAFVHVGITAALCRHIKEFWGLYLETIRISLTLLQADARSFQIPHGPKRSWAMQCGEYVSKFLSEHKTEKQDPVSIRSTLQCFEVFTNTTENVFTETSYYLSMSSGNPLYFENPKLGHIPNGSFLNPILTVSTGAFIEAVLMAAWASVQRMNHILSGKYGNLLLDAAASSDQLGLIQWPKNAQAKLEKLRHNCGLRSFVSGGSTSFGIEDMWSFGLQSSQLAINALAQMKEIVSLELYSSLFAAQASGISLPFEISKSVLLDKKFCSENDAFMLADEVAESSVRKNIPFIL